MSFAKYNLIGIGSPIVDLLARVSEEFLASVEGGKGGMHLVNDTGLDAIITKLDKSSVFLSPGGAAANTTFAASHLGLSTAFLGKLGRDDNSRYYESEFRRAGGSRSRFKHTYHKSTGRCLSLITPDAERTMRTNLGAASSLECDDIRVSDFKECTHVHIEGYLLFNPTLFEHALITIKEAECSISLDLGSFEVVEASRKLLPDLVSKYIDIVFANEDEAEMLYGRGSDEKNLACMAELADITVVKRGKEGALIQSKDSSHNVAAEPATARIDTTGAGDLWAAGFLYAYLNGYGLDLCGKAASYMGARAIEKVGTAFDNGEWNLIRAGIQRILSN
ncbi:MAG: adenosine kinase [Spirochaetes bacterium]|nr:adenosine kinase [Spirochaetota bacterium]